MECLLPYSCMATVPHIMVRLERMLDYRGVGVARFHNKHVRTYIILCTTLQFLGVHTSPIHPTMLAPSTLLGSIWHWTIQARLVGIHTEEKFCFQKTVCWFDL